MASRESRKNLNLQFNGTIGADVAKLINQCKGMGREFRLISEEEAVSDNSKPDFSRMTIVVKIEKDCMKCVNHRWG